MKPIKEMSQAELAAYIQDHLWSQGIEVVLSGGAAVGVFSHGKYISKDIDLINVKFIDRDNIEFAMKELGFTPVGRHFEHPDSDQAVEFPPGPLSLGEEKIENYFEVKLETGLLRTLSPTDSIKDRLSHFFHWGDRQCLEQAKLIAKNQTINTNDIRGWADHEGFKAGFEEIEDFFK